MSLSPGQAQDGNAASAGDDFRFAALHEVAAPSSMTSNPSNHGRTESIMQVAIASDHAGFSLKQQVISLLEKLGHRVEDFGCRSAESSVDLMDYAAPAAESLSLARVDRAILIDGAGYGSGIIANLFPNVFGAVANDPESAQLSREHGGANALCLGAKVAGELMLLRAVEVFLSTEPAGGRYAERRAKLEELARGKRLGPEYARRATVTIEDLREAVLSKRPLMMDSRTVITASVVDAVRDLKP